MRDFWRLSGKVAWRHWSIYRKSLFSNLVPTLCDPLFFIVTFGIGLGAYVNEVGDREYLRYMAPGLVMSAALFTAFFETSYNFFVRLTYEHVYKAMMTTPIGVKEIIAGEFIWLAAKGAFMSTGVMLVLLAFGLVETQYLVFVPFLGSLVALACGGIGLISTGFVNNINQFQTVYALLISPMFFFSGIFYPLDSMPGWVRSITQLSPLYHGVRVGQSLMWAENVGETVLKNGSLLLVSLVILIFFAVKKIYPKLYR